MRLKRMIAGLLCLASLVAALGFSAGAEGETGQAILPSPIWCWGPI